MKQSPQNLGVYKSEDLVIYQDRFKMKMYFNCTQMVTQGLILMKLVYA